MAKERDPARRVRELVQSAGQVRVDNSIAPKKYFRSGVEMEKMAKIYHDEGDLESAFILYSKFITLFVEKLPHHPEYSKVSQVDKSNNKKSLRRVFNTAEELKGVLKEKYQHEYEEFMVQEAKKREEEEEEAKRRKLIFEKKLEEERIRKEQEALKIPQQQPSAPPLIGDYPVPSTSFQKVLVNDQTAVGDNNRKHRAPIDTEDALQPPSYSSLYSVPITSTPTVDRSTKLVLSSDDSSASGLRKINIPGDLVSYFLHLASENTRKDLETCGILTGRLQKNMFFVTHLLIPKQTSTSDSCTTLNEEELFEFQDSKDLITLGWIHTHPSQTSFMSSVDLHTHCSYQLIMPEAIAIVCSPKYSETGVFSLTQEYGLQFIVNCRQTGFHPHPKEPPLYQESSHVVWDKIARVEVVDLRSKR
ncbi:STAM-binding protein-like A [Acropora palmata]|uniref:STAM-binding protein-like A n=1 Tax=Acropora palmata TaxID=6131 RepID=UPI003DA0A407